MKPDVRLELNTLEGLVRGGGFSLQNPKTGNITLIDDDGEFHVSDRNELAGRVGRQKSTQMQFWESQWQEEHPGDLYCRVVVKREAVVIEFGELPRESDALLNGVWTFCLEKLDDGEIIGVVVDLTGDTEEYADWHSFFIDGVAYSGPCPDILWVRKEQEQLVPATCATHHRISGVHHITVFNERVAHVLVESGLARDPVR